MISKALQCQLCLHNYNLSHKLPRFIPQCGHTLCNACITDLLSKGKLECPFDDHQASYSSSLFPTNLVLKNLIEMSTKKSDYAPQEQAFEDELRVRCRSDLLHKNSIDDLLSDVSSESCNQIISSETTIDNLSDCQGELEAALEERKAYLNKILKDRFQELSSHLNMKKVVLSLNVESFFRREKQRLNLILSRDSDLYNSLVDKLSICKDSTMDSQILSRIEEEVEQFTVKLNGTTFKKQVKELKKKFSDVSDSMNEILTSQMSLTTQLGIDSRIFTEKIDGTQSVSLDSCSNLKTFKFNTSLEFEVKDGCLDIISTGKAPKNILVSTIEWMNATEVRFKIDKFSYGENDMEAISSIWSELECVDCIRIDGSFQKEVSETGLIALFKTIFSKPQLTREIEMNFQEASIGDESLIYLIENVLTRSLVLRSLNLNLTNTNLTYKTIEAFTKSALPNISNMESFIFYISNSDVPEKYITEMFIELPEVRNLDLCLSSTNSGNAALKALANITLPSMVNLEQLKLRMWRAKITDEGVMELMEKIPNLTSFVIDLGSNKLTNNGIQKFVEERLPSMSNLEDFELRLYDTEVTEQIVSQIYQLKRSLSS